jgi:hypothetical protein
MYFCNAMYFWNIVPGISIHPHSEYYVTDEYTANANSGLCSLQVDSNASCAMQRTILHERHNMSRPEPQLRDVSLWGSSCYKCRIAVYPTFSCALSLNTAVKSWLIPHWSSGKGWYRWVLDFAQEHPVSDCDREILPSSSAHRGSHQPQESLVYIGSKSADSADWRRMLFRRSLLQIFVH